ncbi:CRAL-TRIO domain-containing protein F28H7.8 [Toxocara canis]|uniref:CRAL-TRIO domain-containing protein F28H7.8 n=1 Tax=Toxocara canis TaxID=6265 RepID=A0A0B2VYS1_TOXCA|nr:CRAL-TRIO domain-containing protein F28H7.8 [Toxocara canis]
MPSEDEYDLTSEQRANIETVRRLIGPEAASQKYCTPFNILRWINAYGNAEEGAKKLKRHLNIRKIKRLDSLEEQAEGIDEVISIYSPISILGRNKISDNKVVLFEMAGRIDIHGMVNSIQTTPFMNNRFRIMERVLRQINEMEEQTKRISGGVFVVDLDGLQLQTSLINILSARLSMPSEDEYDLTSEQRANIETVRRLIGPEAASQKYCTPFNILRWINAYGNAEEGAKKLKRHLNIRKIKRLDSLEEQAEGIDEVISIYSPISILGRNKISDNKVVLFEMAGRIDIHGMVNSIQTTPFMNNRFRIMERVLRQINEMEEQTKRISGGVFVVDLDGLQLQTSLINILSGPYRIMWGTLLEQYPHIFSTIVVVNVPKFMNVLWTVCIPFITEEYRSKIIITSEKWRREILEYIDAECLPVYYGGTMVDKHGDQRCRSLIAVPPSTPFPSFKLIPKVELDVVSIPAGMILAFPLPTPKPKAIS